MIGTMKSCEIVLKTNQTETVKITVRTLRDAIDAGKITYYSRNRGSLTGVPLINKKVYSLIEDNGWSSVSFGIPQITCSSPGSFYVADGHSRIEATIKHVEVLTANGDTSAADDILNSTITLAISPHHMFRTIYKAANQSKAHTGKQCITNLDTLPGFTIEKILKLAGIKVTDFPANNWQALWNLIVTVNECEVVASTTLISSRSLSDSMRHHDRVKSGYKVKSYTIQKVSNLVVNYENLLVKVSDLIGQDRTSLKLTNLLRQAGTMQFLMLDDINGGNIYSQSTSEIVSKLENNYLAVKKLASEVARRNTMEVSIVALNAIMRKKNRKT